LTWRIPETNFYCHTEDYQPIVHHDNFDRSRITYLTERYNAAIRKGLENYPDTQHLLVVDSYYVDFVDEIRRLIDRYRSRERTVLGASIWYWDRSHIRARIRYYDTLSVKEFRNKSWASTRDLPVGMISVSGVGGCFIFPRAVWDVSKGFFIPHPEPQAGSSHGLNTQGVRIILDCDCRLWRSYVTNPDIPDYSAFKRLRVSLGDLRRKVRMHS
jgi:hypothetical protein